MTAFVAALSLVQLIFLIVAVITLIVTLTGIKRRISSIRHEQSVLCSRMDYIRRELERLAPDGPPQFGLPAPSVFSEPLKSSSSFKGMATTPTVPPLADPLSRADEMYAQIAPSSLPPSAAPSSQELDEITRPTGPASKLAEGAGKILKKIWNWLLVNQEDRPSDVTTEYAVASTWLLRLAIIAIGAAILYFLGWSIERELLGPEWRVGLIILAGVTMLITGMRILGGKYNLIGQGLLGGGLLALYSAVWAAGPVYGILTPALLAFGLMILVTFTAGLLAIHSGFQLIAILGIAGGYVAPFMLTAQAPDLITIFSYILLLGLAILAIARYQQWRLLNYLSFIGTYCVYFYVRNNHCEPSDFIVTISFLSLFFVTQSCISFINNIVKQKKSTTLEIVHLIINALVYSAAAYYVIREDLGRYYPAIMTAALAGYFALHVIVFRKKQLADRALLTSLIALAGIFAMLSLPILFEKETLTMIMAVLALMYLWIGRRLGSNFLQNLSHAVYAIVFFRLFYDLRGQFHAGGITSAMAIELYLGEMTARVWNFGVSIAAIIAAFFLQKGPARSHDHIVGTGESDTPRMFSQDSSANLFYWFSALFIFILFHLELNVMFAYFTAWRLPVLTALWCAMGAYFLCKYAGTGQHSTVFFCAVSFFLVGAILKIFFVDLASWDCSSQLLYNADYKLLSAAARVFDFGVVLVLLFAAWRVIGGNRGNRRLAPIFGYTSIFLLFAYATLEVNTLLHWKLDKFQSGGISVLWALFAIAFIIGGIWKNIVPLRYMGLVLFAAVTLKVPFVDLAHTPVIYRVIAFTGIGVIMLIGSFAYIYSNKKFIKMTLTSTEGASE